MLLRLAAAVPSALRSSLVRSSCVSLALAGLVALAAGSAAALDGIDLSEAPAAPAAGECPALIQIKYPFLSCAGGDGSPTLVQAKPLAPNSSWESARQIPPMSDWTEGDGTWGPDLNQD